MFRNNIKILKKVGKKLIDNQTLVFSKRTTVKMVQKAE